MDETVADDSGNEGATAQIHRVCLSRMGLDGSPYLHQSYIYSQGLQLPPSRIALFGWRTQVPATGRRMSITNTINGAFPVAQPGKGKSA